MKTMTIVSSILLAAGLTACSNAQQKEMDAIAQAQQCLDRYSGSTNYQSASSCLNYIESYNSQRANMMKCSILLTQGGLITSKMVAAYNTSQDATSTADKVSEYMSLLAFSVSAPQTVTDAYNAAVTAQSVCNQTGDAGFMFVANMAVLGSMTNSVWDQYFNSGSGTGINFSNPSFTTDVQNAISDCVSNPSHCTAEASNVASAATTVATTYCAGEHPNADVCNIVDQVTSWNTTDSGVTQGLMCLLEGKTFDSTTSTCTP